MLGYQVEIKQLVDYPVAGYIENLSKRSSPTGASEPTTDAPAFFIMPSSAPTPTSAPPTDGSMASPTRFILANGSAHLRNWQNGCASEQSGASLTSWTGFRMTT